MKSAITRKLFLAFFITNLLTIGILVIVVKWNFDRGLIQYIDRRDEQKVEQLAFELGQLYAQSGGWGMFATR